MCKRSKDTVSCDAKREDAASRLTEAAKAAEMLAGLKLDLETLQAVARVRTRIELVGRDVAASKTIAASTLTLLQEDMKALRARLRAAE